MSTTLTWLAAALTAAILLAYEATLFIGQRRDPARLARSAHASLREDWYTAISQFPGSEILAVQTLRNALMSATMIASTAALGLVGTVTLSASSLHESFDATGLALPNLSPRIAMELVLMALLFASLVSSTMAVRYYNHVGFISSMPVGSEARRHWSAAAIGYVRRAGILYSWGLHHLMLVAPILAFIVHPVAGPIAALLVVTALANFDRTASATS